MASGENPSGGFCDGYRRWRRAYGLDGDSRGHMALRSENRGLNALRAVLPSRGAGGDTCVISDACRYIRDLKRQIRELQATLAAEVEAADSLSAEENVPLEVTFTGRDGGIEIHVSCAQRCGMLHAIYHALERLGFKSTQARASFPGDLLVLDVFGLMPVGVNLQIVKMMLMRTIHEVGKAEN